MTDTNGERAITGAEKDAAVFEQQPPLRRLRHDELESYLAARDQGVLATVGPDGTPHLAPVIYRWDPDERVVRMSTRAERVKARNVVGDERAALHVEGPDRWSFAVAAGRAEVSATSVEPGDATGQELLALFPQADDAATRAFLATQVAEQRVVLRLHVERVYGDIIDLARPPAEPGGDDRLVTGPGSAR